MVQLWEPSNPQASQMWEFMCFIQQKHQLSFTDYHSLHAWSVANLGLFWSGVCDYFKLGFTSDEVLNDYQDFLDARWFKNVSFNFAEKLLSYGEDEVALICVNEAATKQVFTYKDLRVEVASIAYGLKQLGVKPLDRVVAIMPNVSYAVIACLATASLGAIWSSCSPDFGTQALVDRLGMIRPKVLFAANGYVYSGKKYELMTKISEVMQAISSLSNVIVCPVIANDDSLHIDKALRWHDFYKLGSVLDFKQFAFSHPLYILFSSGTTGKPKCIVHGAGGTLLQHLKELGLHIDLTNKDNLFFYTTCGWMMWNWMLSSLALGVKITLYDGAPSYPDINRLFKLIDSEKITVFGTSAKFISEVLKSGFHPRENARLDSLRMILSTGSPLLPKHYDFVYEHINSTLQLSSISGGTDIVSCFALANPLLPVYRGELQCLGLGMSVKVFDSMGKSVMCTRGELVCTKPFPSMPLGFWQDFDKEIYKKAYFARFSGVWTQGDFAEITSNYGLIIYGRSDTVLNPGGIRIGTAEIYRVVDDIPEVVESVVIGQDYNDDVRIVLFVKLKEGLILKECLVNKIRQMLASNASKRHVPAIVLQVMDIPRTLNGKLSEACVRQVVHGEIVVNIDSLENPQALAYFKDRLELKT